MPTLDFTDAMTNPVHPVGVMLPVRADSIPTQYRPRWIEADVRRNWTELAAPMKTRHNPAACEFGCKLYARRQGATLRFAVIHSLTYGHSHSPNVR